MKRLYRLIAILALILAPTIVAVAADEPAVMTIGDASTLATQTSPDLVKLNRALTAALEKLGWAAYKNNVALTLSGSVSGSNFSEINAGGDATLSAGIDVLPQLTVTGELTATASSDGVSPGSAPLAASIGVEFKPLADTQGHNRDELAVTSARLDIAVTARELAYTAIAALLDAVSAQEQISLRESALSIAERRLETAKALEERGRTTAEDTNSAEDTVRSARQALQRQQMSASQALLALSQAIGRASESYTLPGWDDLNLEALVADITAKVAALDEDTYVQESESYAKAAIALTSAQIEQAATHTFTPTITATAGIGMTATPVSGPSYSLGLSVTVTPADWDTSAVADAAEDVAIAETTLEATRQSALSGLRIAELDVTIAQENLDAASADLKIAESSLTEAQFKFDRGDVTAVDLSQAQLDLAQAQYNVAAARVTLVKAWYSIDLVQF